MTLGRSRAAKSRKVEIAFHSDNATGCDPHPAVNVKVHSVPNVNAPENARERAWDFAVTEFWANADLIAQDHGYSGVFSEGRSDGWLIPFTQHDSTGKLVTEWTGQGPDKGYPIYPNVENAKKKKKKKKKRRQFVCFRTAIEGLLLESIERYCNLAQELAQEDSIN